MSRMAKRLCLWLVFLLCAFCLTCPTLTAGRNLHFSQGAIQALDEPDPDASNSQLFSQPFSIIIETTPVELHVEKRPFFSEIDEEPFALQLISVLLEKPTVSLATENDLAEPKLPSHIKEDSIESILNQNGLPIGLLPSAVESYTLSDDGHFSVSLSKECYVDFNYEVYYAQKITGTLSYGAISDLSGIQAKKFIWLSVTGIRADDSSSSYIYFDVGPFSKRLSISQFESAPACKAKAIDLSALA